MCSCEAYGMRPTYKEKNACLLGQPLRRSGSQLTTRKGTAHNTILQGVDSGAVLTFPWTRVDTVSHNDERVKSQSDVNDQLAHGVAEYRGQPSAAHVRTIAKGVTEGHGRVQDMGD
jgi:hypothetical protein